MDETIYNQSLVGKQLNKYDDKKSHFLLFNNQKTPLTSKISLGREKSNDIVIPDKLVSRFHAVIQKIKGDFFIKDLLSSNGTFLGGKKIEPQRYFKITQKSKIKIGKSEISFELG